MNYRYLVLLLLLSATLAFATTRVYAPAVDSTGKGILTPVSVTVQAGTGRIRTDIQGSLIAPETEDSIRTAASVASREADANLNTIDINVDIDSDAQLIDGPSGGMAFAISIYNELIHLQNASGTAIRNELVITGAITSDGRAEKVGGVEEKIIAANQSGITLMLIAAGQSTNDALDYAIFGREISNGKLQVVEVHSLTEALDYAYTPDNSVVDAPEFVIKPLILEQFQASDKTIHLRQIAVEEIENARRELAALEQKLSQNADGQQATAVLRSVNESLKNAEEAVKKGYYYTGANAAFLAKINLETVNAEDITPQDLTDMLNQFEIQIKNFEKPEANSKNYEQAAAANLRYWWAYTRFEDAKAEFANTNTVSIGIVRDYYNAKAWFQAAEKLAQHSKTIQGDKVNEFNVREYALDLLEQSEIIANGTADTEIQWHLKTAKKAIAGADYVAAAFDLQFIISADSTAKLITNKGPETILNEFGEMDTSNLYEGDASPWAELYYANGIYSLQEANRSNEVAPIINAIRLKELAAKFHASREIVGHEFVEPRPTKNRTITPLNTLPEEPTISATITTDATGTNIGLLQIAAIIIMALGLVILVSVALSKLRATPGKAASSEEMLDKLDNALVSGRISEETYKRLKAKYSTRIKEEKITTTKRPRTSKERLKRKRR